MPFCFGFEIGSTVTESALTTLVRRKPPSNSDPSKADQETLGVMALPFSLTNITASYKDVVRGKFTDQVGDIYPLADPIADQLSPSVNMLQISRRPEASLHTILEENPDSES